MPMITPMLPRRPDQGIGLEALTAPESVYLASDDLADRVEGQTIDANVAEAENPEAAARAVPEDHQAIVYYSVNEAQVSLLSNAGQSVVSAPALDSWSSVGADGVDFTAVNIDASDPLQLRSADASQLIGGSTSTLRYAHETGVFTFGAKLDVISIPTAVGGYHGAILATHDTGRGFEVAIVDDTGTPTLRAACFNSAGAILWECNYALPGSAPYALEVLVIGDGDTARLYVGGALQDSDTIATEAGVADNAISIGKVPSVASYLDADVYSVTIGDWYTLPAYLAGVTNWIQQLQV